MSDFRIPLKDEAIVGTKSHDMLVASADSEAKKRGGLYAVFVKLVKCSDWVEYHFAIAREMSK